MKRFFSKWTYYLITLFCASIVIISIYYLQKVAPLGKNSLLTIDFFHQYGPMLAEMRDRILSGRNLIYSFQMGMGLPFFRNFFNYLSSPFNILLLFFKHENVIMSYSVIIGLKAVVSALTMAIYLKEKLGKSYSFIAISLLYAFCAYFTAYYWNIMWLDGMVMLPLITLGIDRLVNKNKILIYVISLSVMLFANYFIGYMLCIFSVLYFICELIISTHKFNIKKIFKKGLSFAGASLIAGGLCAIFLIPLYLGLKEISATSDAFPTSQYYAFTLKEFLFNHFTGVGSTVLKSGVSNAPNISVGIIPIALLLLFIINPKIKLKTKLTYLGLLIFIAVCFRWGALDFIWHAFHVPNDLPFRYSFVYSFVLILISAYSLKYLKEIKPQYVLCIYIIMLIIITILKLIGYKNINSDMIIINYIVITIAYLSYILLKYFKCTKYWPIGFFILTASLECVIVVNNNWRINQNLKGFYSDYNNTNDSLKYIKDNDKSNFYRLEKLSMLTFNDPSWYGYYGQVAFSSMEYENMAKLNYSLGMPGNEINSFYYKQNTPIYDLMFNIKYILGTSVDDSRYSLYYNNDEDVYRFNYTIGLMFGVNKDTLNYRANNDNAFINQNNFIEKATGIKNILEEVEITNKEIVDTGDDYTIVKYSLPNFYDNYYMYFDNNVICDFVYNEGDLYYFNDDYEYVQNFKNISIYNYYDYNENFVINNKTDNKNIEVYVGYTYYDEEIDNEIKIYKLNTDKFNKAYNYLLSKKIEITEFKEHIIKANTNFKEDTFVYTSIPYDKGWKVYVDNKLIETECISDTLLGFNVPKGAHNIKLKYTIPYIKISALISLVSLCTLIIWIKIKKD